MTLEMKASLRALRKAPLAPDGAAVICSYECTFCSGLRPRPWTMIVPELRRRASGAAAPLCPGLNRRRPCRPCSMTGANRGLGLAFCRSYAADGWRIHACCRHPEKAMATESQLDGDLLNSIGWT